MSNSSFLLALILLTSCSSAKLSVNQDFSSQADKLPVSGVNGWQVNQKLSFGNYRTSRVKRGWDFSASVQYTKFNIRPEEILLKVFDISTDNSTTVQKSKYQYTLQEGNLIAEIYATEKFREDQLVYKSNNPWIGNASKTHRFEYAFTAGIVPVTLKDKEPWSLVLINKYDIGKDTAKRLFDAPYVEEEGYATNGKESIAIRPLRVDKVSTRSGTERKVLGGNLFAGYELQSDGDVIGIVDVLDNSVWIKTQVDPERKIIIASVSSAILLKRLQNGSD